jgi:hypothetical protein
MKARGKMKLAAVVTEPSPYQGRVLLTNQLDPSKNGIYSFGKSYTYRAGSDGKMRRVANGAVRS